MVEIEVKLRVPTPQLPRVRAALAGGAAQRQRQRLQAAYYDSPDQRLAARGMALRLRREGTRWVQTVKVATDPLRRLEHNVPVAVLRGAAPALDLHRHAGTPAGDALREAVGAGSLVLRYGTDITRTTRMQRLRGAVVELALDEGHIVAGERREPVCELELELVRGSPQVLLQAAQRWADRYGLWLDVRSKAWRGECLAQGVAYAPAVKAAAPSLRADDSVEQAWAAVVQSCLAQILPNASEIASEIAGDAYAPEHVHQLRVGLRRLRSAMKLFEGFVDVPPAWAETCRALFAQLGAARDRDVLEANVLPALRAAGAPELAWPARQEADMHRAGDALREPGVTRLWLALMSITQAAAPPTPFDAPCGDDAAPARARLVERVQRWHRQLRRDAADFAALSDEARHVLRKRAKRLRYAMEFCAAWWHERSLQRQLDALRVAQDALGRLNDVSVALPLFEARAENEPAAWFAVGWLRAQRDAHVAACAAALRQWRRAPRPWKR